MKFAYTTKLRLSPANKQRLLQINKIIQEYQQKGYRLTLRQLYYQLVSRDVIANKQSEYSKLSTLLTQGRMGGIVDWDAIEDRLRRPYIPYSVENLKDALRDTVDQYRLDRMKDQQTYIEVWVEKDALSEVLKRSTDPFHIRVMVNRGYSSTSAMHDAFERIVDKIIDEEKKIILIYLGDHDPSGMDMVRDIKDRLEEFFVGHQYTSAVESGNYEEGEPEGLRMWWKNQFHEHFTIERIGLNMDQIKKYKPAPNPAKITDPRAKGYIEEFGPTSWEVDALKPEILHELVQVAIRREIDDVQYQVMLKQEKQDKEKLKGIIKKLGEV